MTVHISRKYSNEGVVARLLGPLGVYPPRVQGDEDHGYLFSQSACISVVRVRSAMLSQHMLFMEEAITTLFISMEASFRLICRRLAACGNKNPNAHDAAVFLGEVFNEQPLERYFEEYYDNRVATLHPESRFGIFPHAPLMADDYYHLRDSLRYLYVYLLTGEVIEDT